MFSHQPVTTSFVESNSIADVRKYDKDNDSWFVFDLDNTVHETSLELGSDQWFRALCQYGATIKLEDGNAVASVIAIYHAVQKHVNTVAVEQEAVDLIQSLQAEGRVVIGLTSRDTVLEEATYRQLESIGINLREKIIFCSGADKGVCFVNSLKGRDEQPQHVIMAEDLLKHLVRMKAALQPLGIDFTGIRYGYLDEKVKHLDMGKAHIQLFQLKPHLPERTQHMIECLGINVPDNAAQTDYMSHFYFDAPLPKVNKNKPSPLLDEQGDYNQHNRVTK
mgnify:CR=1 FL=1